MARVARRAGARLVGSIRVTGYPLDQPGGVRAARSGATCTGCEPRRRSDTSLPSAATRTRSPAGARLTRRRNRRHAPAGLPAFLDASPERPPPTAASPTRVRRRAAPVGVCPAEYLRLRTDRPRRMRDSRGRRTQDPLSRAHVLSAQLPPLRRIRPVRRLLLAGLGADGGDREDEVQLPPGRQHAVAGDVVDDVDGGPGHHPVLLVRHAEDPVRRGVSRPGGARWSFVHMFRSTKPCWPFTASPYIAPASWATRPTRTSKSRCTSPRPGHRLQVGIQGNESRHPGLAGHRRSLSVRRPGEAELQQPQRRANGTAAARAGDRGGRGVAGLFRKDRAVVQATDIASCTRSPTP